MQRLNLANIIAGAMATVEALGLTGPLVLTRPPAINPLTGASTGSAVTQEVQAVEMDAAEIKGMSGEGWQRATCGVFVEAAKLTGPPLMTDRATWASTAYEIAAISPMATTGTPLTYAIGLAV